MTSPLDIRTDAPGLLRTEAMSMSIKFDRTGPTTGRITWNIPRPAAGCAADDQAYCGIIVTIDGTANNSTKLPVNGTVYNSDPTADGNLFAGDTIGSSKVVGAFYHDRTTTFMDISGLTENGAYFVSGFPVDCENRYYREGIHAYSLNYQQDGTQPTSGTQVVILNPAASSNGGVEPTDVTGLVSGITYTFKIRQGLVPKPNRPLSSQECVPTPFSYTITIAGDRAQTYQDLLNTINTQLQLVDNPPQGPNPPNAGAYYYDSVNQKLYLWDGTQHTEQLVIIQATAPNTVVLGTYWYDTTSNILSVYDGTAWSTVNVISFSRNPASPNCETTYWFDGTNGYTWNGNAWCLHNIFTGPVDPSMWQPAPCGSFWYNDVEFELWAWDDTQEMWKSTNAVQHTIAPNTIPSGTHHYDVTDPAAPLLIIDTNGSFWFNTTTSKLNHYGIQIDPITSNTLPGEAVGWIEVSTARITEVEPTLTVIAGTLWYNPSTMVLKQRNVGNTAWTALDVIVYDTDPTLVAYCSNWWNTANDQMYVWDGVNNTWNQVANFWQQSEDPTTPPSFAENDLWYDPTTGKLYYWQNNCFIETEYLLYPTDPRTTIPNGTVWHDTINDLWFVKTPTSWNPIDITFSNTDPTTLSAGTLWINTSANSSLQMWNGVAWVALTYSNQPLTPTTGMQWFNTTTNKLMTWNGANWSFATPKLLAEFNCNGNLIFTDTSVGSLSWTSIENVDLFSSLAVGFRIDNPNPGSDGVSSEPLYQEIGIGTDGTNDERLQLMTEIRYALGYPTVDVELAPEQLMQCIDLALQTLREHSSICYTRGFFFLNIHSETQKYLLTNKVSGMHKIVDINGVHRLTSAFLSSAHGAGVYGQIVLQHLYNMGTFDLLSYHIMTEYTKNLEILFAGRITYTWNEQTRELWLHHRYPFAERMVLIDASVERTEQQIISDRICRPWIRKWATAEAQMMLANTRGKFSTLPGAGGGVTLNASDLRQQATTDKEQCMAEIFDFVVDNPEEWGVQSSFTFG